MKLTDRLNVLIQAITLSQKSGSLSLDEAVTAKTAIDIITSGVLDQKCASAINVLIEIAVSSQKKGVYSLKDAYMIYTAIYGIETTFKDEILKKNTEIIENEQQKQNDINKNNEERIVTIPPKILKRIT